MQDTGSCVANVGKVGGAGQQAFTTWPGDLDAAVRRLARSFGPATRKKGAEPANWTDPPLKIRASTCWG